MSYTILEVHQVYDKNWQDNKLKVVAVLWQSNRDQDWVRASFFTDEPRGGYGFLMPDEPVTPELIQRVAAQGTNLPDNLKKKYFPGKRRWER